MDMISSIDNITNGLNDSVIVNEILTLNENIRLENGKVNSIQELN